MSAGLEDQSKAYFRRSFTYWLEERPKATLGQLRKWLEEVYEQCSEMVACGDPPIEGTDDIPCELAEYLDHWDDHDGESFSYREADIEEDIMFLDEFIEELGSRTRLASFPVYEVA